MKFTITLLAALLLSATSAQAALVETDWKTEGDAQATLDTETGIEWLDLTETHGMSIGEVESQLTTTYTGWRFPTSVEVEDLIVSAFPSHAAAVQAGGGAGTYDPVTNDEARAFRSLFGSTHEDTGSNYSLGFFKTSQEASYSVSYSGLAHRKSGDYVTIYNQNGVFAQNTKSVAYGVFLVSDGGTTFSSQQDPSINANNPNAPSVANVSAPVALGLAGLGLFGLAARRRASAATSNK